LLSHENRSLYNWYIKFYIIYYYLFWYVNNV